VSSEQISFLEEEIETSRVTFTPSRDVALERLKAFAPFTGRAYASGRNYDLGSDNRSNISALSPWIRHRMISEEEVLKEALQHHSFNASEKFLQEVFWRAYFKGWLEQRPQVWQWYRKGVLQGIKQLERDGSLNKRYNEAINGSTGIEAFDFWTKELVETGYLHNHARMWFASIWIFTLELPWELGADFFYRHLLDGDPASNTCSWRWVAGLHTKGKNYAARASNIAKFTNGRFSGHMGLAVNPVPLSEPGEAAIIPPPLPETMPNKPYVLLVTEEDMLPETLSLPHDPEGVVGLVATDMRSPLEVGMKAKHFALHGMSNALERVQKKFACGTTIIEDNEWAKALKDFAVNYSVKTIVTAYAPVGPVAEKLAKAKTQLADEGIQVIQVLREYDEIIWPHATRGFFKVKKQIPKLLDRLGLA